jgi:hypothetical protein
MSALRLVLLSSLLMIFCAAALMSAGCNRSDVDAGPPEFAAETLPGDDDLMKRIDEILDFTLKGRRLNSRDHAAWQVVHGILAFGSDFPIEDNGEVTPALDWLLKGGTLRGWHLRVGDKGVFAVLEPGSKEGQGHPDQWLGYLSQCGLGLDEQIEVAGRAYKIRDMLEQAKWDIYPGMEATWTLMAFSTYLPLDAQWENKHGDDWTLERVVASEAGEIKINGNRLDAGESACGGSHRLFGLSVALNRYLTETRTSPDKLAGGWKAANDVLEVAKRNTREFQQRDGTFSVNYFARPGTSSAIAERIGTTGHLFEVMATCMTQRELESPWMVKACDQLCTMLEQTKQIELECGGLYHASHGLFVYRARRWGLPDQAKSVASEQEADASSAAQSNE